MRILVTGAAGFIGSNLCQSLLDKKHQVIGVDNFTGGSGKNIRTLRDNSGFKFIKHDIVKPLPESELLTNLAQIYHLACPTGVENLESLGHEMLLACSLGTINVLEAAKRNNAKLLFTSSSEVYGDAQVFPQEEAYTGNVKTTGIRSPYEEGKRFSESAISFYARRYKLDAKIVRVFNTYGPGMSTGDNRVIPMFLKQALGGKPLTLHGKGEQARTFCYVNDLVKGLCLVIESGKSGEVYNLGGNLQIKIKKLARIIIKLTGTKSSIRRVKRPFYDHQGRLPTLSKVKKLGWQQKVTLEEGLLKTISWLKSQ